MNDNEASDDSIPFYFRRCRMWIQNMRRKDLIDISMEKVAKTKVTMFFVPITLTLRQVNSMSLDCLFLHNEGSNCKDDGDKFLLSLKNFTTNLHHRNSNVQEKQANPSNTNKSALVLTVEPEISNDFSKRIKMNVLAYIAGYIVNKLQLKLCTECYGLLKGDLEHSNSTGFLTMKQLEMVSSILVNYKQMQLFTII